MNTPQHVSQAASSTAIAATGPTNYTLTPEMQARVDARRKHLNERPSDLLVPVLEAAGFNGVEVTDTLITRITLPAATDADFRNLCRENGFETRPLAFLESLISPLFTLAPETSTSPAMI